MEHTVYNMDKWKDDLLNSNSGKALPIMTYPGLSYTHEHVIDILTKAESQYRCIKALSENFPAIAVLMVMDLSVEAEAFGAKINFHQNETPDVSTPIVHNAESIENLIVPDIEGTRAEEFVKVPGIAANNNSNKPIFGGMIGPYSLSARLFDMIGFMMHTLTEPESAKALLRNKLDKAGDVILCDNKAKNVDIAVAMARLFNAVSVQKNKPEWLSYFVTMPKLLISKATKFLFLNQEHPNLFAKKL